MIKYFINAEFDLINQEVYFNNNYSLETIHKYIYCTIELKQFDLEFIKVKLLETIIDKFDVKDSEIKNLNIKCVSKV